MLKKTDIPPPVEASGGQEEYYVRSSWHSEQYHWQCIGQADVPPVVASGVQEQYYIRSFSAHFIFSFCRGRSYIGIFLGDLSSWTWSNLCRFICCIVVVVAAVVVVTVSFCCCCSSVIVDPELQINNNNNNKATQEQPEESDKKDWTIYVDWHFHVMKWKCNWADISQADVPPKWTECYRAWLHQVSSTYCRMPTYPVQMYPPNQTKCYRILLHQIISHIVECQHTQGRHTPTNQTQCYRGLLHQISITYCRIPTYPGQMYPPLIKPSATKPHYTRSVSHIADCWHTQGRHTPC